MAKIPSPIKIKKDGVEYISYVDRAQWTIAELSRAALKDVSKLLRRRMRDKLKPHKQSGTLSKNVGTWVRKRKNPDDLPFLQVGIYTRARAKKKGYPYAFHAHFLEFGTSRQGADSFIRRPVIDCADDISKIQGKYLSAIEDEERAFSLIDDKEEITDD